MVQNECQPNILDRLHQIMFKIIILSHLELIDIKNTFSKYYFCPPLGELCSAKSIPWAESLNKLFTVKGREIQTFCSGEVFGTSFLHSLLLRFFGFFCDLYLQFIFPSIFGTNAFIIFKTFACVVFEAIEVKGQLMFNFEAAALKFGM